VSMVELPQEHDSMLELLAMEEQMLAI